MNRLAGSFLNAIVSSYAGISPYARTQVSSGEVV